MVKQIFLLLPDEPAPVPVTDMFADNGEDRVTDWDSASYFVAGPLASGRWIADETIKYAEKRMH